MPNGRPAIRLGCRDQSGERRRPRGLGERGAKRLAWSALGQDRLVCRLSGFSWMQLSIPRGGVASNPMPSVWAGDYDGAVERINSSATSSAWPTDGCRKTVAGYTVKREYFNSEFSAGIENVAYDAHEGFNSPMFIRTVKLKDFPWNGWLALGVRRA